MEIEIPVTANVNDDRRSSGIIRVREFHSQDQLFNALKKLVIFWLVAVACVLIPVFHFILVPLFFFVGLFAARRAYKSKGRVLQGETSCPNCQIKIEIKPADLNWPLSEICQNCTRVVRIEKA